MNKVIMQGILAKDNYFKVSEKGNAFLTNSINIQTEKANEFFNIVAFGKIAEDIADKFNKGDILNFEGKLKNNSYEKNGEKKYTVQIVIDKVFIGNQSDPVKDEEFPF